MDKNKTAFPYVFTNLNGETEMDTGMTLRDYFANSAMQGMLSARMFSPSDVEVYAEQSYKLADEMLKEREK